MAFKGIAFNTANLVGQVTGWKFSLNQWMDQHHATVKATDEKKFGEICSEISKHGYRAIELWQAHADPSVMTEEKAKAWKKVMADHGISAIAWAGGLNPDSARVCGWLGIPMAAGGIGNQTPDQVTALARQSGIRAAHENHPEKSAQEILAKIGGGNEWLGVAVDTGWLGTQGVPAAAAIRTLGKAVHHLHLKDVKAAGGHHTVPLGEGCVGVAECLAAAREIGYTGWISWEDEPEDRNPFAIATPMREWIASRI